MSDLALPTALGSAERPAQPATWLTQLEQAVTYLPAQIRPWLRARLDTRIRVALARAASMQALDDPSLYRRTLALRERGALGQLPELPDADELSVHIETIRRRYNVVLHAAQLQTTLAVMRGAVVELATGEGKTLAAALAALCLALRGERVHVITANDYLAARDASALRGWFSDYRLSVALASENARAPERAAAWLAHVTYVSNKTVAFEYLRDRLKGRPGDALAPRLAWLMGRQRRMRLMVGLPFAIVDEADSVLIDEARTPLVLAGGTDPSRERRWAEQALGFAGALTEAHYRLDARNRHAELQPEGRAMLDQLAQGARGVWAHRKRREEAVETALAALHLFQIRVHYLVQDGRVQIVDEYSGRILERRAWGDGLQQLIEVKEGCPVSGRPVPAARMTFQRFFRRYRCLGGLTATAGEARSELWFTYQLPVVRIQPHFPERRVDWPVQVLENPEAKWRAIAARCEEALELGRAVLVGTRTIEAAESASRVLDEAGIRHVVLSAAQHDAEARIVAEAGQVGRVTIATNMAGRGVHIPVPEAVAARGGLHVILSELHDAARIDRQLFGRTARLGLPGSAEVIVSLQDPLAEQWLPAALHPLLAWTAVRWPMAALAILRFAQRRAETTHRMARMDLLSLDQRQAQLLAFTGGQE